MQITDVAYLLPMAVDLSTRLLMPHQYQCQVGADEGQTRLILGIKIQLELNW